MRPVMHSNIMKDVEPKKVEAGEDQATVKIWVQQGWDGEGC